MINLSDSVLVFDLDDTLYKEIDFLHSGYKYIAKKLDPENHLELYRTAVNLYKGQNDAFAYLSEKFGVNKQDLIQWYRSHYPDIRMNEEDQKVLIRLKRNAKAIGLVSDGRSITQRNKLKALNIIDLFQEIIISEEIGSEKTEPSNFLSFKKKFPGANFAYIGDNLKKDFGVPNNLGWLTFCLRDDGRNIHSQKINIHENLRPQFYINNISELLNFYET